MNIEVDRLAKDCLWRQIHAGKKICPTNPYMELSNTNMKYQNITYAITSNLAKINSNTGF